jgi:hypothetical protein
MSLPQGRCTWKKRSRTPSPREPPPDRGHDRRAPSCPVRSRHEKRALGQHLFESLDSLLEAVRKEEEVGT